MALEYDRWLSNGVFLRTISFDSSRVITPGEYVSTDGAAVLEALSITFLQHGRVCGARDADYRHVQVCPRGGAQVNQHQPLIGVVSTAFKRLAEKHAVEDGPLFSADEDFRMDITIPSGEVRRSVNLPAFTPKLTVSFQS